MKTKLLLFYILLLANTLLANKDINIFNKEENNYLKNKQYLRMCTISTFEPFEQIINGVHIGIIADINNLFKKQLPIPVKLIEAKTYKELFKLIDDKKCDFKPVVLKEFSIYQDMILTKPYIADEFLVITKTNTPFIVDINNFTDKTFAVKFPSFKKYLAKEYPDIKTIFIPNQEDIFEKIKSGELFGYIGITVSANHEIEKYGFENLKVNTKLDDKLHASIGIANGDKLLVQIFNKIIENTPTQYIEDIKLKKRIYVYK